MGRIRIPFFYYSDFLEVGYAYNWITPPKEVYQHPFSSIDGFDISQRFSSGDIDGSVQFYYGRYQGPFVTSTVNYPSDFKNFTGIALNTNMGNFGGRLSYHQAELITTNVTGSLLDQLIQGANGVAASLGDPAAAKDFTSDGQTSRFYETALFYDDGDINLIAEWTLLDSGPAVTLDNQAWMLSAAKRFDDMTFHATYATSKDELASGNVGKIQKLLPLKYEANSIILGLRYDYDSSTALKFEVQNKDEVFVSGAKGKSANLFSVSINVVF